jgi:hypothetical protein
MVQNYLLKTILTLLLTLLILCLAQKHIDSLHITIKPNFKGEKLNKDTWFITNNKDSIKLKKIKFYLTNFNVLDTDNKNISIVNSNFLIDAFITETLTINLPNSSNKEITEISFNIGVEEQMNTDGALAGDLDPTKGMYWSWQSGYINFKIEGVSPSCKTRKNKFMFHIGGYEAPFKTTRKVSFKIDSKNKNNIILQLNLDSFFNSIDLKTTNQIMIPGEKAKDLADKLPKLFTVE